MKELENLVDDLKNHLSTKESVLRKNPKFNSYTESFILNRHCDIESFQFACRNCNTDSYFKKEIFTNFKKESDKIKLEIDKITC